jgi:two-component system response regulator HupR/HoxA
MPPTDEPHVLLAGPALAADRLLHKRLSGDCILGTAQTIEAATAVMESGDIDVVLSEQQYADGRGVDFLQRMRGVHPNSLRILVLVSARREEIVKAINDAAIYQVITSPWEPELVSLLLKRALESRELARIARSPARPPRISGVEAVPNGATLKATVEHLEAQLVRQSLQRNNWNSTRASRELGLSRVGLANKVKRYHIDRSAG